MKSKQWHIFFSAVVFLGAVLWLAWGEIGIGRIEAALPQGVSSKVDIAYGSDISQKLDVFYKKDLVNRPVVIGIHGGGWIQGDKTKMRRFVDYFVNQRGYVYVTPNYRTSTETTNKYPIPVYDVAVATKWVHDNIAQYKGDGTRIVLMGNSAGSHIGALVVYGDDPIWLVDSGLPYIDLKPYLKGFFGAAGVYDFDLVPTTRDQLATFLGSLYDPAKWSVAEPVTYVTAGDPPAILFSGTNDCFVNIRDEYGRCDGQTNNSVRLSSVLASFGISGEVVFIAGNHGAFMDYFTTDLNLQAKATAFLNTVFP